MDETKFDEGVDEGDEPTVGTEFAASGYELSTHPAHMIRRAHQRATMCFQQVMGDTDLTPTQHAALSTLLKHGELSQNHLGRLTAMDPSTISLVIRKLTKRGLVQGYPSPTDQRMTILRLTEAGVAYTVPLLHLSMEAAERFLGPLNERETATFLRLLAKLQD